MKASEVLQSGSDAIVSRGMSYGHPADTMERTAALWSAYLEIPITSSNVAVCMALVKLARLMETSTHPDSWIDLAGYVAIAAETATEENELYV